MDAITLKEPLIAEVRPGEVNGEGMLPSAHWVLQEGVLQERSGLLYLSELVESCQGSGLLVSKGQL
eukprot:3243573-Prorocentrum_lima.AAC.1